MIANAQSLDEAKCLAKPPGSFGYVGVREFWDYNGRGHGAIVVHKQVRISWAARVFRGGKGQVV